MSRLILSFIESNLYPDLFSNDGYQQCTTSIDCSLNARSVLSVFMCIISSGPHKHFRK